MSFYRDLLQCIEDPTNLMVSTRSGFSVWARARSASVTSVSMYPNSEKLDELRRDLQKAASKEALSRPRVNSDAGAKAYTELRLTILNNFDSFWILAKDARDLITRTSIAFLNLAKAPLKDTPPEEKLAAVTEANRLRTEDIPQLKAKAGRIRACVSEYGAERRAMAVSVAASCDRIGTLLDNFVLEALLKLAEVERLDQEGKEHSNADCEEQ